VANNKLVELRQEYFYQKNLALQVSMEISSAIQDNFSVDEKRKSDSRVVFASFNDLLGKFQKLLQAHEE
jgi:hypothetical protein